MLKNQTAGKNDFSFEEIFLTSEDAARCSGSLAKLSRHLEKPVAVTGSIATGWHFWKKGLQSKRPLNDIDVIVEGLADVRASLSEDFLINHFHPFRGKGRVLIQLVDREQGTRIEIFTPNSKTLSERLTDFAVGGLSGKAVSAEDVAAKLLSIVYSVAEGKVIDPKYVEHFRRLLQSADLAIVREIWQDYRNERQPVDFDKAVEIIEQSIAAHPKLLQTEEYCQNIEFECHWCVPWAAFPIAPRAEIYEILGYV